MPKYNDGKVLKLTLDVSNHFDKKTISWSGISDTTYFLFNSSVQVSQGTTTLYFSLDSSLAGIKISQ